MMAGIGRLYGTRFHEMGITTIAKLASIDLDAMPAPKLKEFMDFLRRDKGTLTKPKLQGYIQQARDVIQRTIESSSPAPPSSPHHYQQQQQHQHLEDEALDPSPKRQKLRVDSRSDFSSASRNDLLFEDPQVFPPILVLPSSSDQRGEEPTEARNSSWRASDIDLMDESTIRRSSLASVKESDFLVPEMETEQPTRRSKRLQKKSSSSIIDL
eukprot:c19931_g1_i1.p1 GENE.c19931_g1_i1~~c19931_g1_i1.p1  ORF type:complete len:212 (+),score=44.96 c19931_g1_i1:852-1487(+)